MRMNEEQELLYQALQVEMGGVEVYRTALRCVQNDELKEEWEEYLEHTQRHVEIVHEVCAKLGLDP
jgi:rubrerythrin